MSFKATLSYHCKRLEITITSRNFLGVLLPRKATPIQDLNLAIAAALDRPVGSPPFDSLLQKGDTVVIIVSDLSRYTAAHLFLPFIVRRLQRRGIPDKDITILFSLGIHRAMTFEEQKAVVGETVAERIRLQNHDCRSTEDLVSLGTTGNGTPVIINRRAAEADKVILTGSIGLHYLAGFGGGRKSIIPGIAAYESCVAVHLRALMPAKGRHPHACAGNLQGNPMHEEMMDACELVAPAFLMNTVISPSDDILEIVAGNWKAAFFEGCRFVDSLCKVPLRQKADLVIASCGGFPRDINFIQAHKTLDYAMNALRSGGALILVAACKEGIGNQDFLRWLRFQNPLEMETELRRHYQINGQTAYATLLNAQRAKIFLLSELPDFVVRKMSITPVHSLEEAFAQAQCLVGDNPLTYLIPHGSMVFPCEETTDQEI